jgi:hypothetical protein
LNKSCKINIIITIIIKNCPSDESKWTVSCAGVLKGAVCSKYYSFNYNTATGAPIPLTAGGRRCVDAQVGITCTESTTAAEICQPSCF